MLKKGREFDNEFEWLIHHLWLQPSIYNVRIPDTLFIKPRVSDYGERTYLLGNWYFSAQAGQIQKKHKRNVML